MMTEPLISMLENLLDYILNYQITDDNLRRTYKRVIGKEISKDVAKELIEKAKPQFKESTLKDIKNLISNDKIDEKIRQLKEIIGRQTVDSHTKKGWRPAGMPQVDCYAHIRPLYMEHEEFLTNFKQSLERDIERKKKKLESLHSKLEMMVFNGCSVEEHSQNASPRKP
ncbi:hypothetical protein AB6A40_005345 [Gnathostoma spinigerum]|uniref:Uncharacterized protein n=1 Tax=Gnathostoma spinigerum TaxID=75299 RepID=A0ABD6EG13_9BILA